MNSIKHLYILGNHIQALGLARMAARTGMEVTLFNSYGASVTRFSNCCHHFVRFTDHEDLLRQLLDSPVQKDALLLATNDSLIGFMADHYKELDRIFQLSIPCPASVQICFNKRETYQKARDLGIPIPESWFPDTRAEIEELSHQLTYPVILKPAVMFTFHDATGKKAYYCPDPDTLLENYDKLVSVIPPEEVIVQEFLSGGAPTLFSFGSFFAEGKVYGSFVANRIRQKPMDFGVSTCFAHTVHNPVIEKLAIRFLEGIGYFGVSEVEFMYDENTRQFKLLEINPRAWKWHSIANKLGINLVDMMRQYLEGKPVEPQISREPGVAWVERLTDTYVVLGEIVKGNLSLSEYLKTMRMPKESAVWSLRDPLPALMYIIMAPYLLFKRG